MATRESEVLRATARESLAMLLEGNARFCAVRGREQREFFFRFFFVVVVVVEVEVEKTFPPFFRGTGEGLSLSRSLAAAQPSRLKPLAMKT